MIFDRNKQTLLLEGKSYTAENIRTIRLTDIPQRLHALFIFLQKWFNESEYIDVHTSGSTGTPKIITIRKEQMMQSAKLTCEYLKLKSEDTALLCMNLRYIGAMMVVVRALISKLNLIVRQPSGHPLKDIDIPLRFAAMVPIQVYNTLLNHNEKTRLNTVDILIIGGGAIDAVLENRIKKLPGEIYSTYGMTETLSHIALRRLNGNTASSRYYPFPAVHLSLSEEGTLIIDAPSVCDHVLVTNDMAYIYPDQGFEILGRKDNVVNSGGIKIQIEEVENSIKPFISNNFAVTYIPDERLGQALVLLAEGPAPLSYIEGIKADMEKVLPKYHVPQYIYIVKKIPLTENKKINRSECHILATRLAGKVV